MASEESNYVETTASEQTIITTKTATIAKSKSIRWTVRPMKLEDIDKCLEIWNQVSLTEAYQTVASELKFDPDGFYVAEIDSTGEVVGMCAGPLTRTDTAFMGFYAVEPAYQGSGIGRELWAKTTGRLGSSVNVGLYGVPSMSAKYKKSGFVLEDTQKLLLYESQPDIEGELKLDLLCNLDQLGTGYYLFALSGLEDDTYRKLIEYDASVNKFSRESLLREYFLGDNIPLTLAVMKCTARKQSSPATTGCCMAQYQAPADEARDMSSQPKASTHDGFDELYKDCIERKDSSKILDSNSTQLVGYGCVRLDNTSGGMVGPIYADSGEICEVLLKNLLKRFKLQSGAKFSVMALSSNRRASEIANMIGFKETDQCSRMFTKFIPTASLPQIYYIHSPNFSLF